MFSGTGIRQGARLESFVVLCLLLITTSTLSGQTADTGALTGTVTDPSGAVLPMVTVTLTNSQTAQVRVDVTGASGTYKFGLLLPSNYQVSFSANGFSTVTVPSVAVIVSETAVLDRTLQVGTQNQSVTVTAETEAVQTETATLGTVVGQETVSTLPLSTRNYTNLLALAANTSANVNSASILGKGNQDIAVNGAANYQNNFQMDGVSSDNYTSNGQLEETGSLGSIPIPNPDSIQEFKIQTSMFDAGSGRNVGANVTVVTKSGTNDFHGTMFEFFRNTVLNANEWFFKRTEQQNNLPNKAPVLDQNQYGGVIGGPIKKDKLFFFVSYQETHQDNGLDPQWGESTITMFPIPAGDRSNTAAFQAALGAANCPANHPGVSRFLTQNGVLQSASFDQVSCTGSNISPVAIALLQLKNPNGNYYIPSVNPTNFATLSQSSPAIYHEHQGMGNWDYVINSKNTLSGRYFFSTDPANSPFCGFPLSNVGGCPIGAATYFEYGDQNSVIKLTTVLSNTLVNQVYGGYQRDRNTLHNFIPFTDAQVGITPVEPSWPRLSGITVSGLFSVGAATTGDELETSNQYHWGDLLSWTHGRHSIRLGIDGEDIRWFWNFEGSPEAQVTFPTSGDFLIGLPGCSGGAAPPSCNGTTLSNISGLAASRNAAVGNIHHYVSHSVDAFVQDDFKVNQHLTLNLGVRWEYDGIVYDSGGLNTNVWPSLANLAPNPGTGCVYNGVVDGLGTAGSGCSLAGYVVSPLFKNAGYGPVPPGVYVNNQNSTTQSRPPYDDFAPRVGFAWQPLATNRFVVRGGIGVFYDRIPGRTLIQGQNSPPYVVNLAQSGAGLSYASLGTPFLTTPLGWVPRWVVPTTGASSNLPGGESPIVKTPLTYAYTLGIEYEFMPSWVLELGYAGSHGVHQQITAPLNPAFLASPANPINGITTNTVTGAAGAPLRVPYLGFSPSATWTASPYGSYKYNSMDLTLRKRLSYGLTIQAAYTYLHALIAQYVGNPNATVTDNVPILIEDAPNLQYHPNRFVLQYSWDLPLGHPEGLRGKLAEGWTFTGVTTIQDGIPMTITDGTLGNIFGTPVSSNAQYCAGMGPGNVATTGSLDSRVTGYFNTKAFTYAGNCAASIPTSGNGTGYGDSGLGIVLGPPQNNWDMSLIKTTKVGGLREDATLQFRAEFFNTFNHAQFNPPCTGNVGSPVNCIANVTSPTFGVITSTSVNPRLVQFALRYAF